MITLPVGAKRETTFLTSCISRLSEQGKVGRILGPQADLLRSARTSALQLWRENSLVPSWAPRVRRNVYRRIWDDAAEELGAACTSLGGDFLTIRRGAAETIVWYHQVTLDDAVRLMLVLDKGIVQRMISAAGLPVAPHLVFDATEPRRGLEFMEEAGRPCVVKPAGGTSGGDGITCGVDTPERFRRAVIWAHRWDSARVHVERQIQGQELRFLFMDGELLGIVRRRPPQLVGDGRSTVVELMAAENRRRAADDGRSGTTPVLVDLDCLFALEAAGFTLRSVVPAGESISAKTMVNQSGSADTDALSITEVSPDLVANAAAAAAAVGIRLASVEIVTPDPMRSLQAAGGVVLEVNGTPGLSYHYLVSDPDRVVRVAVPILARLLGAETSLRPQDAGRPSTQVPR